MFGRKELDEVGQKEFWPTSLDIGIRTLILIIIVDYSDRPIQSLIGGKPDNLTE